MEAVKKKDWKERIAESGLIGPMTKTVLLRDGEKCDPIYLEWLMVLLDNAEKTAKDYGVQSKKYIKAIQEIEQAAKDKVLAAKKNILEEFESESVSYTHLTLPTICSV